MPLGNGKIMDINTAQTLRPSPCKKQDRADEGYRLRFPTMPSSCITAGSKTLDIEANPHNSSAPTFRISRTSCQQFANWEHLPSGFSGRWPARRPTPGQYYLDHAVVAFRERLTWRWILHLTWNGHGKTVHPIQAVNRWRPVLVYSKGDWHKRRRWGPACLCVTPTRNCFTSGSSRLKMLKLWFVSFRTGRTRGRSLRWFLHDGCCLPQPGAEVCRLRH